MDEKLGDEKPSEARRSYQAMIRNFCAGNALSHPQHSGARGWMVGHFLGGPDDLRLNSDVEVKWGTHSAGERRHAWAVNQKGTTLSILVRGKFRISFIDEDISLEKEGDYALWGAEVPHIWEAEEDSVVVTIRWPSEDGDSVDVPNPRSAAKVLDFPNS